MSKEEGTSSSILTFLVLLLFLSEPASSSSLPADDPQNSTSPSSAPAGGPSSVLQVAKIEGDILLGGIFPVHAKGDGVDFCGELNEQVGIHRVEAMLYAVDQVNSNKDILPNITLAAEIRDDCGTVNTALEQCLNFVLGTLNNKDNICHSLRGSYAIEKKHTLGGVVGPSYSTTTIQVASLLRLFDVPQVSYAATSVELSEKTRFEYFVRTVPPDSFQAQAMVDIINFMNWTAVFAVYSRGSYGEQAMLSFRNFSLASELCITVHQLLEPDFTEEQYDQLIDRFRKENEVRVVVLFCNFEDLRSMLQAAKRAQNKGMKRQFIWLASDFWGTRYRHLEGLEGVANGAISLEIQTFDTHLKPFYDYFAKLNPLNNTRNPWFKEYWEHHFDCKLGNDSSSDSQNCSASLNDRHSSALERFDAKVPFVIDAVLSFAHALHSMHRNVCGEVLGLCPEIKVLDRKALLQFLRDASFNGTTGHVKFDANGDSPGKYDVYIFQNNSYQRLGSWVEGHLNLDPPRLYDKNRHLESHCGKPCDPGAVKRRRDALCCWSCEMCDEGSYVADEFTCKECSEGTRPNATLNGCEPLHNVYLIGTWIVATMILSSMGMLLALFVCGVFLKFADTPLIKASGHELSILLLVGVMMCYGLAFVMVSPPGTVVCAIQRLGIGLCFCICYASLLVRTNRIARIFSGVKTPSFISPKSQLLITSVIIAPELAVALTELLISTPNAIASYEPKDYVLIKCNISTVGMAALFGYNAVLIVLCTFYAFRTRKTPLNFNEVKFIGFCMYTTCAIWIAFVPVYYGIGGGFQAVALAFSSVISATTILVFIFMPKVYIVLLKPEKNIKSNSRLRSRTKSLEFNVCESRSMNDLNGGPSYSLTGRSPSFSPSLIVKHLNGEAVQTTPSHSESWRHEQNAT